jgi:hypothetical protein
LKQLYSAQLFLGFSDMTIVHARYHIRPELKQHRTRYAQCEFFGW